MGSFNPEDKVGWEELAPSLQDMIKHIKADITANKNNSVTNVYSNATAINQTKGDGTTNIVINIDTATSTTSTNPVQNKVITAAINAISSALSTAKTELLNKISDIINNTIPSAISDLVANIDTALSTTSTNPVQNKVIAKAINTLTSKINTELLPIGTVIMFSGTSIPKGWHICDGSTVRNSRGSTISIPDMRDLFVVGAGKSYGLNTKGGLKEFKLTVDMLPEHRHTFFAAGSTDSDSHGGINSAVQTISDGITGVAITNGVYNESSPVGRSAGWGGRQSTETGERAGSPYKKGARGSGCNSNGGVFADPNATLNGKGLINNLPPYIALYYIMKYDYI